MTAEISTDMLRASELAVVRGLRRVDTQKSKLADAEAELTRRRAAHADMVDRYRQQHCGNGQA